MLHQHYDLTVQKSLNKGAYLPEQIPQWLIF